MNGDVTVFAETNFRNQRRKFGIKRDDRRRHMYVVGKTGMGKSTLLENMIIADIRAGNGLAVVDPHGDLAEKILQYIPNNRVNDVIYFNPSDTQFPIAFNILESIGDDYKHLVAYGLVGVFKKIWADSWGPRMEYIMTNTILALLEYPGSTLLGLMRMLVDKAYRKKVVAKVQDPVVKTFWADEYANYSEKFRTEAIAPIQNKVGQFLASSIIRNIVGQSKSTIEMRDIMDKQKILIMNLAKGRIGEENSALLGAMMITKLQIAAMSRVDIPEPERKDFYLYVDEFQNFATDSFAGILSEARKYRLCLIMAHQYFEQLGDVVKAAVFGNVGTMIVFRVGAADAAELELEFAPQFLPADIVNLKKYTFCLRLMVDGVATEPFSGIGLPPAAGATSNLDKIIKVSRERYARPQAMVEERIIRWSGVEINKPGAAADGTTDGADDNDDQGDNMNWPEPTWKVDEESSHTESEDNAGQAVEGGVKIATAQPDTSSHVNPSGFIPGEQPAMPEPSKTPVRLEPTVQLAPELEAASSANTPVVRPRISFINHQPSVAVEPVEEPIQPQPEPIATASQPADTEPDEMDEDLDDDDEAGDEEEVVVETVTPKVQSTPVSTKPVAETTNEQRQPSVQSNQSTVPSISLQALKQGDAPSVKFTSSTNNMGSNPQPSGEPTKRKRKRKRKRGGSGNGDSAGSSMNRPNNNGGSNKNALFPVPAATDAPKPRSESQLASAAPTPKPNPQPKPEQPKPATNVNPGSDPTKVSWGDLLQ